MSYLHIQHILHFLNREQYTWFVQFEIDFLFWPRSNLSQGCCSLRWATHTRSIHLTQNFPLKSGTTTHSKCRHYSAVVTCIQFLELLGKQFLLDVLMARILRTQWTFLQGTIEESWLSSWHTFRLRITTLPTLHWCNRQTAWASLHGNYGSWKRTWHVYSVPHVYLLKKLYIVPPVFERKFWKYHSPYWERVWQSSPGHGISGVGVVFMCGMEGNW